MTKVNNNYNNTLHKDSSITLDKLEVTSELFFSKSHESLYRSAIAKYKTQQKVKALFQVSKDSNYWKAWHCNETLIQEGKRLKGSLCRKRWCQHCNRIKTAEMINGYQSPLKDLASKDQLYLVTLTAPTVKARQLASEISKRYKMFVKVKDRLRKRGIVLNGIRKLEVTHNIDEKTFHPHFHFVVQGQHEAEQLLNEWLSEYPTAKRVGQDISPIETTSKDLMEVFKYSVKDVIKDTLSASASHTIYKALKGRRVFQTFGEIRKVKPPKEKKHSNREVDFLGERYEIWGYEHSLKDFTTAYGEKMLHTLDIEAKENELKYKLDGIY